MSSVGRMMYEHVCLYEYEDDLKRFFWEGISLVSA